LDDTIIWERKEKGESREVHGGGLGPKRGGNEASLNRKYHANFPEEKEKSYDEGAITEGKKRKEKKTPQVGPQLGSPEKGGEENPTRR